MTVSIGIKDFLSLSISATALLISSIGAYFNFFKQSDDAQVRVADFDVENTGDRNRNRIVTQLVFFNRGNQPFLVTAVESVADTDHELKETPFGAPVHAKEGVFPFVLEKGQLKLVEVTTPLNFIEGNASPKDSKLYYGLKFASINSQGKEQGSQMVFGEIHLNNKQTITFKWEHVAVSLLGEVAISFRTLPVSRAR